MKRARNFALLLTLTAGTLALPCVAQQEVNPDIYDATARSSVTAKPAATRQAKPATRASVRTANHRARSRQKNATPVIVAKAHTPHTAAK